MSMILDALKRSREEDDLPAAVPSIDTTHEAVVMPSLNHDRFKRLFLGIGLIAAITLGVLISRYLLPLRQEVTSYQTEAAFTGEVQTQTLVKTRQQPQQQNLAQVSKPDPESTPTIASDTALGSAQVAALYRNVEAEPEFDNGVPSSSAISDKGAFSSEVAGNPSVSKDLGGPSPSVTRPDEGPKARAVLESQSDSSEILTTPNRNEGNAASAATEALPLDFAAVVQRVQAELGKPALIAHATPLLENLSQQKKNAIPTVMYTVHDWRSGGQSEVTLNDRVLREGQQVNGLKVEEILSDSVILSYRGTAFRLRALNSWVNL